MILLQLSFYKTILLMMFVILSCQWTTAPEIMVYTICSLLVHEMQVSLLTAVSVAIIIRYYRCTCKANDTWCTGRKGSFIFLTFLKM